jgi:hypothetical protein
MMVVAMTVWMVEMGTGFGTYYLHRRLHTGCSSRHSTDIPSCSWWCNWSEVGRRALEVVVIAMMIVMMIVMMGGKRALQ